MKLNVTVESGKNLKAMDRGKSSDPYVVITLIKKKIDYNSSVHFKEPEVEMNLKTKVIKKNLNPVWNETFLFEKIKPHKHSLKFGVFDWDRFGKDDPIGEYELPVHRITNRFLIPGVEKFEDTVELVLGKVATGVLIVKFSVNPEECQNDYRKLALLGREFPSKVENVPHQFDDKFYIEKGKPYSLKLYINPKGEALSLKSRSLFVIENGFWEEQPLMKKMKRYFFWTPKVSDPLYCVNVAVVDGAFFNDSREKQQLRIGDPLLFFQGKQVFLECDEKHLEFFKEDSITSRIVMTTCLCLASEKKWKKINEKAEEFKKLAEKRKLVKPSLKTE